MCRFLIYKGHEVLMSDLLTRSEQSLIRQSYKAREREEPLNGDGFGIGWYLPEIEPAPGVFTSTSPAWSNRNLRRLADKVRSGCFFAHVRAASPGAMVSEANCHPFQHERYLWMHNGAVAGFREGRRALRQSLSDRAYDLIQGNTDSEHAFACFVDALPQAAEPLSPDILCQAMAATIDRLVRVSRDAGATRASRLNFAVTDGASVIVTRFVHGTGLPAHTLYVARGERFQCVDGHYRMRAANGGRPRAVIIASEPLSEERADWQAVSDNHMVLVTPELDVQITPIH